MINLTQIRLNPKNPRTITPAALAKLAKSIESFPRMMELRPIVVDDDGMILGGNMRYRAITEELGMRECPPSWVVRASDLTPEQRRRFILADNAPVSGAWDFDSLASQWELPDLVLAGFDAKQFTVPQPPGDFRDVDENLPVEHVCPRCGYKFSGGQTVQASNEPPDQEHA